MEKPKGVPAESPFPAHVGGHHNDGVAEVRPLAVGVGEHPVLHDLEQKAPHVGVGFLQLVEQENRVGMPPDRFGELAAILMSHITRGESR